MADTVSVTQAEKDERLGEALFALSAQLKASGFLADSAHHRVYERVVAAFNLPVASTQPAPAFPREEVAKALWSVSQNCSWDDAKADSYCSNAVKGCYEHADAVATLLQGKQP